ncbi:ethanolamine ammonia-lyase subunit EutC [Mucilaginibacter sp. HD30]
MQAIIYLNPEGFSVGNEEIGKQGLLHALRAFTPARIGLGRTGSGIPLKAFQEFKLAHAHARDAVYSELDVDGLKADLDQFDLPLITLHSAAAYREQYLQRPDLGRKLDEASAEEISNYHSPCDVAIIITDGLSATAVNNNTIPLLRLLVPMLAAVKVTLAPITLVKQGRVAISDEIAYALGAKLSLILIGERPGLSAADSVGAYITFNPKPGLTDESRNCISNIRPQGLNSTAAAKKIFYIIQEAFKNKLTGVRLKDNEGLLQG